MNKLLKSILVLVCICSFIAVLLALTNSITYPIIQENEKAAANKALLEVMPEGGSFESVDISSYTLPSTVAEAYRAENGGYVFKLVTTGYSGGFVIMCGVNADGTVSGAVCISSTETLGYEKTYGQIFGGKSASDVDSVELVSGATKTTGAYRSAVKDAINASIILGGGSVDLRTEEEIFADALALALPAGEGKFTQMFLTEDAGAVEKMYSADNGSGYVCVIGEKLISVDASSAVRGVNLDGEEIQLSAEESSGAISAVEAMKVSTKVDIDTSAYTDMPTALVSAQKTASGNYILEIKAAGYGINGGNEYHPASGEYIVIKISLTRDGKILDCITVSQAESKGIGDVCAEESFYGQFDGKTEESYKNIDAISGATLTTNGYLKGIERAFEIVKILEGGGTK